MDKKIDYACPICKQSECRLFQGSNSSHLWFCGWCARAFWLVTNLLDEKVFILHSPKIKSYRADYCKKLAEPVDPEELPF